MQGETELKLSLPVDQAEKLRKHPLIHSLKSGRARTKRLVGIYYDTPDLFLKQRDMTLRVREVDRRHIQTLKRLGPSVGGLHVRDEWENEVNGKAPDISHIKRQEIGPILDAIDNGPALQPIFRTDVKRTAWTLRDGDLEIELALDIVEIRSEAGRRESICEAELELKSGDPDRLFDIALAFNERVDCTLGHLTKADRGYALCGAEPRKATKASVVVLDPEMTAWQAFVAICESCLRHLEANDPIVRTGEDPEGVHQARVAIRRLRAAFRVFRPILPEAEQRFFAQELRWLQRELGDARDWDVFIIETIEPLQERFPDDLALREMSRRSLLARRTAYAGARNALDSGRYGHLRLALQRWVMRPTHDVDEGDMARNVGWFARRSIRRAHKRVVRFGPDLAAVDEPGLHDLRIRGKQARYCAEFFSSLFPGGEAKRHSKLLAGLQDCLGALNDAVVADQLLARLNKRGSVLDARAAASVEGWFAALIGRERKELRRVWPKIRKLKAYWKADPS